MLDLPAELAELATIQAEAIGWIPLGQGAYLHHGLHHGHEPEDEVTITVVGLPDAGLAGQNVLLIA